MQWTLSPFRSEPFMNQVMSTSGSPTPSHINVTSSPTVTILFSGFHILLFTVFHSGATEIQANTVFRLFGQDLYIQGKMPMKIQAKISVYDSDRR